MNLLSKLLTLFTPRRTPSVTIDWYRITFDDAAIHLRVTPPGRDPWAVDIPWSTITRVCFEAADLLESDSIYLFTTLRPESYVIPTEGIGGNQLWSAIIDRKLFDPALAVEALTAHTGLFCWPPFEKPSSPHNEAPQS
ncbi:MAG: hypothetical protein ACTHN5_23765 [Phycisphaerae bacterium]